MSESTPSTENQQNGNTDRIRDVLAPLIRANFDMELLGRGLLSFHALYAGSKLPVQTM